MASGPCHSLTTHLCDFHICQMPGLVFPLPTQGAHELLPPRSFREILRSAPPTTTTEMTNPRCRNQPAPEGPPPARRPGPSQSCLQPSGSARTPLSQPEQNSSHHTETRPSKAWGLVFRGGLCEPNCSLPRAGPPRTQTQAESDIRDPTWGQSPAVNSGRSRSSAENTTKGH